MPAEGLVWKEREEILTFEEIERAARLFVSLGVDKIRLTGGEPTVRRGLEDLIGRVAGLDGIRSLLMTTNGLTLRDRAKTYRDAGLNGLNVSIDSLRQERFAEIARRDRLPDVLEGIEAAIAAGFDPLKINVVVMKGVNEDEILDFVHFVRERPVNVRFIEFMPFKGNGWDSAEVYPYAQIRADIESRHRLTPIGTDPSAVAKDFAVEGHAGTVGFVTSMTDSFCAGCNRIRLTADGQIKSCLFSPAESDLRSAMRSGATDVDLEATIRDALHRKPKEHPPMEELLNVDNRSMIQIGG
jgi:cyclic pyranopterin phosphate synthase